MKKTEEELDLPVLADNEEPAPVPGAVEDDTAVHINFEPKVLPASIYYSAGDKEFERMLPYLIGHASTARLKELAAGRNVKPTAVLRQAIFEAESRGLFQPMGATEKRTANDDRQNHNEYQRMQAVLSQPILDIVIRRAKEHRPPVTNKHCLYFGVKRLIEVSML